MNSRSAPAASDSTGIETEAPMLRARLGVIFPRHVLYLSLLLVLPVALSEGLNMSLTLLRDPDLWWHLANARLLFSTGHFIHTEPYSFTVAGQDWVNPEWLAEVPYWLSYRAFGLRGIYLLTWLAVCVNIVLVYWRGYARARNADASFWAAGIGFLLMTVNAGPRMIAFGYAALSLECLILESSGRGHRRLLWWLPLVFCAWVNLHGSWIIGIALLVLYIGTGLFGFEWGAIAQQQLDRADRRRLITVLVASCAALFINPYGWRLVWNPVDMMLNQKLNIASVSEWRPLQVDSFEGLTLLALIVLLVLANLKRGHRWKPYDLAIVFFAIFAALDHVRFLYLAAVLISPILAAELGRSFCAESDGKTIPAMNGLIAAAAICFIAIMFPSETKLQTNLASEFPLESIRMIQPGWRTFNWDYVGGRMAFDSRPSFIDSRLDTFEHHGVFKNYMSAMNLVNPLQVLDHYQVDHVLVLELQPIAQFLNHIPGWKLVHREKVGEAYYVLFVRDLKPVYPNPPTP
jgi:hypothetical protein